jgi:integrase
MSSYVQNLYRETTGDGKSDDKFLKKMEGKYSTNTLHNIKSVFKKLKMMCVFKETTFDRVVEEFTELKKTESENKYLEVISKFLQDFIEFNLSSRPCPRCFVKNTNGFNSKKCPQCNNTKTVKGVDASAIGIYLTHMKKPLRYYGLLSGVSNEDMHAELDMPTVEDEEPEPLTAPFIRAILGKVKGNRKLYWWFVSGTGLRGVEGIQIMPEDCSFVNEDFVPVSSGEKYFRIRVNVRSEITKSKKSREVFVPKEVELEMERLIKNTPVGTPLFRKSNTLVETVKKYNNTLFVEICEELAREDPVMYGKLSERKKTKHHKFTFHSFRSFAVTGLNRVDYGFGHALAGHGVYMGRYNRLTVEQKKEYLEKSDEYLAIYSDIKKIMSKDNEIRKLKNDQERRDAFFQERFEKIEKIMKL